MAWDIDCLPTLSITFPKSVRVENTRLAAFYWVLVTFVVSFVLYNSHQSEVYLVRFAPEGSFSFWITDWKVGNDAAKKINQDEGESKHCQELDDYAFCDSADCSGWSAQELQCVDICTDKVLSDCLEMSERFVKESDSLFVPTFFHEMETLRKVDGSGAVTEKHTSESWRVVKGVTEMGIGFDHEFLVQTPQAGEYQHGSSILKESQLLTVLHDSSNNEIQSWQPGESISLSLSKLLQAADINLDVVQSELGQNFLEGAKHPEGLLTRIAGLKLWIHVQYYNQWAVPQSVDWHGPIAIIQIKTTEAPAWVSRPKVQVLDANGSQRLRYYHGIEIQLTAGGSFAWVSTDAILGIMTQILVFAGLAKKVVYLFTIRCIGLISEVYKGFLYQQCSLSRECYALAARLCSHTSTFVELKDVEQGITKTRIHRRFTRIFKPFEDELDEGEVQRLVEFVFHGVRRYQKADPTASQPVITVDGFSAACSHGESLRLGTMIRMFDANREKKLLERIFAGPDLKKLFKSDKATRSLASAKSLNVDVPVQEVSPADAVGGEVGGDNPIEESEPAIQPGPDPSAYDSGGTGDCASDPMSPIDTRSNVRHEMAAIKRDLEARAESLEASQKQLQEEMDQMRSMYHGAKQPMLPVVHEQPVKLGTHYAPPQVELEDSNVGTPQSKFESSRSLATTAPETPHQGTTAPETPQQEIIVVVDQSPPANQVKVQGSAHDASESPDQGKDIKNSENNSSVVPKDKTDQPLKNKDSMCCG
eukprot:gnl/MRDRNA2_/MRDRNA2_32095_c0_seq1.p1 gnl/MRDRNA2_/MRDRNA2_32095_c0~~gnl/MRDRNA2_/MRDRNA2_32095_c0_seq1.p1  ORF type:complete len:761 (+),score=104.37 gnl/MRDRNA2_/MRDRNA2_32095_c0_seq1:93-2375(+)